MSSLIVTVNKRQDIKKFEEFIEQSHWSYDSVLDGYNFYFPVVDNTDADILEISMTKDMSKSGLDISVTFEYEA